MFYHDVQQANCCFGKQTWSLLSARNLNHVELGAGLLGLSEKLL